MSRQEDSLSSFLFNIVMNEIIKEVRRKKEYEIDIKD
jgi:DNA-directed RNA polymerase specialized sigma24 family protein